MSVLTPIERVSFSYTLGDTSKNHAARATVLQFPIRLSWALTAHKVGWIYIMVQLGPSGTLNFLVYKLFIFIC